MSNEEKPELKNSETHEKSNLDPVMDSEAEDEIDGHLAKVSNFFKTGFIYTTKEEIQKHVFESETFGWSWSVYNSGFYHTAIVIHLDENPTYSVNWGPVEETRVWDMRNRVKGEITFGVEKSKKETTTDGENRHYTSEKEKKEITYKPVLGSLKVSEDSEPKIKELLDHLLSYNEETYHLIDCNCRDHVLDVLSKVGDDGLNMEKIKEEIDKVKLSAEKFWEIWRGRN